MEKNSSISSFKNRPYAFVLFLMLVFAYESLNMHFDYRMYPKPYDGLRIKLKNQITQNAGNEYDVLILGDCYNLTALDPLILEKESNIKAFNFSTHAAHTVFASYLFLKNYLKHNEHKPKYIIMTFLPESTIKTKQLILESDIFQFYDFIGGNVKEFYHEFGWVQTLKLFIPSLKHQQILRKNILSIRLAPKNEIAGFFESVDDDRGYYRLYGDQVYRGRRIVNGASYRKPISQYFDRNFNNILDIARKHNIKVIYPIFAAPPDWHLEYQRVGMMNRYMAYLKGMNEKYEKILFLDMQPFLKEKEYFRDSTHLNWVGAKRLSAIIARILNSHK